ncbi:MAG TPA: alpha/beta hydrolase-fold protein [Holophagaceae bacterium]|nr:alpha/beta hydrolase-fold protein [Holophagaceae bacterium]
MRWIQPCALNLLLALPLCAQDVQADGRVTFRFYAPSAGRVLLDREGAALAPMTRDERGMWRITTAPLAPDVYAYHFLVDGIPFEDPACAQGKPILSGGRESLVEVHSDPPQPWDLNAVPHGTLHQHRFASKALGESREVWVYTPPEYDAADARAYPTLYLLHGVMEDAQAWTTAGRADFILDTLIARKQAVPMVVVFPLGYGFPDAPRQVSRLFHGVREQRGIMDAFERCLFDEILPLVERSYHVRRDPDSRAIAGASMGGAQALYLGLRNPDRFGRIGSFSGAFTLLGNDLDAVFPALDAPRAPSVWMACGTGDFLLGANRGCAAWLESRRVPVTEVETPGDHTWMVWRRDLIAFAPSLFKPGAE